MNEMKFRSILLAVFMVSLVQWSARADEDHQAQKTQQVVVHLSHFTDDLHRCFMALKMANLMQVHGAEVTIFLDLEGVRLAERRQVLDLTWGEDSPPLADHYNNFIEAGGKVVLCPHCAKSARIGDGALKRHAEIATMPSLGKLLTSARQNHGLLMREFRGLILNDLSLDSYQTRPTTCRSGRD